MTVLTDVPVRTLIDDLLAEQQSLTAVERFAQKHERQLFPQQARYFRQLIPLNQPAPGEQYAFAVDLDACTGCKACVSACHSLNGLDEDEVWRNVGMIHGGDSAAPYQQTVTTACHHCLEPACLDGCPVRAYEKDQITGIVRHLDDQCIGCQYCVLKCPYDVPKYSHRKGIVRKCDMCSSRLAADEAPACVQACPTSAISIRIVARDQLAASFTDSSRMLPGAFPSNYTQPTTTYVTRKPMPANARAGDGLALRLEHAHWPLIWMLLLTQTSAGMYLALAGLVGFAPAVFAFGAMPLTIAAFVLLNLGLAVSVLHLGKPLGAWRAFLGLRTSWMSREIFAFSAFAAAAGALTFSSAWPQITKLWPAMRKMEGWIQPAAFSPALTLITAVLALAGVFCSAMIYIDTRRSFWAHSLTSVRFFGTMLLLGVAGTAAVLACWQAFTGALLAEAIRSFAIAATIIRTALFGWEALNFRQALSDSTDPNHFSALTLWKLRRPLLRTSLALFVCSTTSGLLTITESGWFGMACATLSFALSFASQTVERYCFFAAVVAPRMPGSFAPSSGPAIQFAAPHQSPLGKDRRSWFRR